MDGNIQELRLRRDLVQTGEMKEEAWGGSGKLLTLSYDVSDEDLEKGSEWTISVASVTGMGGDTYGLNTHRLSPNHMRRMDQMRTLSLQQHT